MKKKIIINILVMSILILLTIPCFATIDTGHYKDIYDQSGTTGLNTMGNKVIGIVKLVGTALSVALLMIAGVKYMMASPSEKADFKGKLIAFAIGAVLVFAASQVVVLVIQATQGVIE